LKTVLSGKQFLNLTQSAAARQDKEIEINQSNSNN